MSQAQKKILKFGTGIALILGALAWLAWTGVQESKSYYVTIKELHNMGDVAYTRHFRVGGSVEPGSIHQMGTSADFVLVEVDPNTHERQLLHVSYKGAEPPPDTFKDNADALALGEYGHDGVFHAKELQAKCASKYATKQGAAMQPPSNGTATQPAPKGY
jgi:cytochrome c-type biogenesis protein CcmE